MKVAKLKELLAELDEQDDIHFEVELPKQGQWVDYRAQMKLGRLKYVDSFSRESGKDVHYSFACKLEIF